MVTLPSTRSEAKKLESNKFYTGKPCHKGHIVFRHTCTGSCSACRLEAQRLKDSKQKRCSKCQEIYQGRRCSCVPKRSRSTEQKEAHRKDEKLWRQANPERYRARVKSYRFLTILRGSQNAAKRNGHQPIKATVQEFTCWYKSQPRVCQICGTTEHLVVDHCHSTGNLRGIVCRYCNTIVGILEGKQAQLQQCVEYLKNHSKPE